MPAVERMTRLAANSFHAATKVKMIAVTIPGQTNGRLMRNSVAHRPAPSICAASSISCGTLAKKLCMIHTANARLKAALTRIIASQVSTIPNARNCRKRPATSTAGWSICVTSTRNRKAMRPGNRKRAVKYAAGRATIRTRTVAATEMTIVETRFCGSGVSGVDHMVT
ncbi:hypothetical protein D3C74_374820 [compost metagenome]